MCQYYLLPSWRNCCDRITRLRHEVGMNKDDPYIFATLNGNGYHRGWDALSDISSSAHLSMGSYRHWKHGNAWNATDFCVWSLRVGVFGSGEHFLFFGFWALASCHWFFLPRSNQAMLSDSDLDWTPWWNQMALVSSNHLGLPLDSPRIYFYRSNLSMQKSHIRSVSE